MEVSNHFPRRLLCYCLACWCPRPIIEQEFLIAPQLLSIGQSAAVFIAVDNGYGEYMATLSDAQVHAIMVVCIPCADEELLTYTTDAVSIFGHPSLYCERMLFEAVARLLCWIPVSFLARPPVLDRGPCRCGCLGCHWNLRFGVSMPSSSVVLPTRYLHQSGMYKPALPCTCGQANGQSISRKHGSPTSEFPISSPI